MGQSAVAKPTIPLLVDAGADLGMAAPAIISDKPLAAVRQADTIGNAAGVEGQPVLKTVNGFPGQVAGEGVIVEMAVYAGDAGMGPGVKPGFVLGLEDVAAAAEFGGFGFGVETGGAESQENSQGSGDGQDDQNYEACPA